MTKETFLKDIKDNLENICVEMEKVNPTNILFGHDETHILYKAMINLCLEYIDKSVKLFNKEPPEITIPYFTSEGIKLHHYPEQQK